MEPNRQWMDEFRLWLERRFPGRSTAKHYVSDLNVFLNHYSGPLEAVTSRDVDAFVEAQHQAQRSVTTINRRVAALKSFYDFLAERLDRPGRPNPVDFRRHAGRPPRTLPRDLNDNEVERLLAVIDSARDLALVSLMLYAGLRVSEVAHLRPCDLAVPAAGEAPISIRVMGKGQRERQVYLCRAGYQPLADYLSQQPAGEPQAPLFRNQRGQPLSVAGIQERITHYGRLSGVAVTCHRLRHTYSRRLAEQEIPVLVLARLLGHQHLQTTQRYIEGADPQVQRSYQAAMDQGRPEATAMAAPPVGLPPRRLRPWPPCWRPSRLLSRATTGGGNGQTGCARAAWTGSTSSGISGSLPSAPITPGSTGTPWVFSGAGAWRNGPVPAGLT